MVNEKKINEKASKYCSSFKSDICKEISKLSLSEEVKIEFAEKVQNYGNLLYNADDLSSSKRKQNTIPMKNRCMATKIDGLRCTRKMKDGNQFCGLHLKSSGQCIPVDAKGDAQQQREIFTQDINGIIYYLDNYNNVYKMDDVLRNDENPGVIAKYTKSGETYNIIFN